MPRNDSTKSGVTLQSSTDTAIAGMDLAITHCAVEALIPYARNARTHSDAQVAEIAASIRAFGWTNPILVDGASGVIAGHGRLLAARKLGLNSVPVIELAGLSEAQKRAYVLADNKLGRQAARPAPTGWFSNLPGCGSRAAGDPNHTPGRPVGDGGTSAALRGCNPG
jgi:hypothetical protein